jgi:hypothetical protein
MEQVSLSLEYILYERGQIQQIYSYNFALWLNETHKPVGTGSHFDVDACHTSMSVL